MPCLIKLDMHHTWMCIMPWLCSFVYHVVCFFPVLLLSSGNVAIVRIRSTTLVCLLHGLVLLPSGISGKMTVILDLTTIIAMLVLSMLSLCRATHCYLLSMHWFSLEEERVMYKSSVSISLSFWEPRYQSSGRLHANPSYLHKQIRILQPTR